MAGIIPPEIVEQVRHASDIVDVIGSYVPLKKSGAKFKALSPFNKEKTPSFYVDPARQMFKCFSSGHGGDVFKFIMLMENMSFPEVIRRLAQRAGIVIPESDGTYDPQARSQREEPILPRRRPAPISKAAIFPTRSRTNSVLVTRRTASTPR